MTASVLPSPAVRVQSSAIRTEVLTSMVIGINGGGLLINQCTTQVFCCDNNAPVNGGKIVCPTNKVLRFDMLTPNRRVTSTTAVLRWATSATKCIHGPEPSVSASRREDCRESWHKDIRVPRQWFFSTSVFHCHYANAEASTKSIQ